MTQGAIFDIKHYAIHDGPGVRTTVFFKGCPLGCWWCHNPEGLAPASNGQNGARTLTSRELIAEIEKDTIFHDESGGGVTFSGGEPLMQPQFLIETLRACREREIHTALDTSAHAPSEIFNAAAQLAQLVLFDVKIIDDAEHVKYTGVSNRQILENIRSLARLRRPMAARFPVVPGATDSEENLEAVARFLAELAAPLDVHLLPYHKIATGKYHRLGLENKMKDVAPPSDSDMRRAAQPFEKQGFSIIIGG